MHTVTITAHTSKLEQQPKARAVFAWAARYNAGLLTQLMPKSAVFSFLFLHVHALKGDHHLLLMLQESFRVLLLVVPHIDVPDTPGAIFGGCHHLCGVRCKSQAQYLTLVTLEQKQKSRVNMQACT